MANEVAVSIRLSWSKSGAQIIGTVSDSYDQSGSQAIENVQIIGSSSEAVTFGDVTTVGWVMFKNLNETGKVHIGTTNPVTSVNAEITLDPGEGTFLKTTQAAWYAIRDSVDVNLLVIAIEL
jgi:hypothetical protein